MATCSTATLRLEEKAPKPVVFYHPELDILRFCAFLMVFLCHAATWHSAISPQLVHKIFQIGRYGVDLFFALSAYLITEILLRERRRRGTIDVRAFYIRRILRIWPLYFAFLLFTFFAASRFTLESFPAPDKAAFLLFLGNYSFLLRPMNSIAGILWSVSIEEQFYLSWPLVLRFSRNLKSVCIALLTAATAYRIWLVAIHAREIAFWQSTFSRIDAIAFGALLAVILDGAVPKVGTTIRLTVFATGAALIVGAGGFGSISGPLALITFPAVAAGCSLTLYAVLVDQFRPGRFARALTNLGRISYGLYVFHWLALVIVGSLLPIRDPISRAATHALFSFILTVILAAASYRWLESRFLVLKERYAFVARS